MTDLARNDISQQLSDLFPRPDGIPEAYRLDPDRYAPLYLIDGKVRRWEGRLIPVNSPICLRQKGTIERTVIGQIPAMDGSAALAALDAARRAWNNGRGTWPQMGGEARIEAVRAFASALAKAKEEIVRLLMWEIGKSIEESRAEVDRTLDYIELTIEAVKDAAHAANIQGKAGGMESLRKPAPIGVCLLMGPFNNPLYETYTMLVPALLMGNVTIVKAPKFGAILHQLLFWSLAACFPPGTVNFIYGGEKGVDTAEVLMKTGDVNVFSFIGSETGAGALVRQHPKPLRLRTILSLGAKNAALIMPDADIDSAVRECVMGSLGFNGQRCTALKILFVHESIAERFLPAFFEAVDDLPIGMPWQEGVKITPLPESGKTELMAAYVNDALSKGAMVLNRRGGTSAGTLFSPAVLYPVGKTAELYWKEQFGPVVPISPYGREEEFFDFVASSDHGQQVSLFGRDYGRMAEMVKHLENQMCRININCKCQRGPDILPFAGRKDSGMTVLSVRDTLQAFSLTSVVAARSNSGDGELLASLEKC
jgi:glyceraldehyde-3-phosphate dehydrogenase (NADP+)